MLRTAIAADPCSPWFCSYLGPTLTVACLFVCSTSCSTPFRPVLQSNFLLDAAHFPTWESAVGGFASAGDLRKLRKAMAADPSSLKPPKPEGPRPKRIQPGQFDSRAQGHVLPFPGVHHALLHGAEVFSKFCSAATSIARTLLS